MGQLAITVLGGVRVVLDGQALPGLETSRSCALLIYLAMQPEKAHPRQFLVDLLWPERSKTDGLNSLRFALSNLRVALQERRLSQPFLLADRQQVQWNPAAATWVDALIFQQQADACEAVSKGAAAAQPDGRAGVYSQLEALQAALDLYRGSFLYGFPFAESMAFESWALHWRERIDHQRLRLLHMLAMGQEVSGSYRQAEATYRQLLALQPWDEETHRKLMRLFLATSQRSAALAQYEACRLALQKELGTEPEHETVWLYQHIQQQPLSAVIEVNTSAPPKEPDRAPFVARERELACLSGALTRMLTQQGGVVWVSGEAGSGKTTLLSAFAVHALTASPDLLVVGGHCNAFGGIGQPYLPFIEIVQMLAGERELLQWTALLPSGCQARLRAAQESLVSLLSETAPALLDRFVGQDRLQWRQQLQTGGPTRRSKAARARTVSTLLDVGVLTEQITRFLSGAARHRPLVLLLDDLQWIDQGSAALLFHLARRLANSRVLIVSSYRPAEIAPPDDHPLTKVIAELRRQDGCQQIDLDRVDGQAFTGAYLKEDPLLRPNRLNNTFCATLARHTGGNPLFTVELLRSLQARGDLWLDQDGIWISNPKLAWDYVPERVEAAIAARMARLPDQWRDWLSTASVEGETFTAEVIAQVHGFDEAVLQRDLNGLPGLARGDYSLLHAEGLYWLETDGPNAARMSRYQFRHILFQTYLYQQLNAVERRQRHAAVGFALEALYGKQPEEQRRHAAELARHFEEGGLPERAAAYFLAAGKQAVFLASAQSALSYYRRGLELLAACPPSLDRDRLELRLWLALGAPFLSTNGWGGPQRHEAIQRAYELAKVVDGKNEWLEFFLALYYQADWLMSQYELAEAALVAEQLLKLSEGQQLSEGQPGAVVPQAYAHLSLGINFIFQCRFPEARSQLEQSLADIAQSGLPSTIPLSGGDLEAGSRAFLAITLLLLGYPEQAQAQVTLALARARSLKNQTTLGLALMLAGEVAIMRGEVGRLQCLAEELLQLDQIEETPFFLAYGLAMQGYARVLQSEPGCVALEDVALMRRAMQMWEATGVRSARGQWMIHLADACLKAGQVADGIEITSTGLALLSAGKSIGYVVEVYRLHGELLLQRGERSAAGACFEQARAAARQQNTRQLELRAAVSLAKLWRDDRPLDARNLLEEICAWFSEGQSTADWQAAQALLKELASSSAG